MKHILIIPASGTGTRFGSATPKQFLKIQGKEIIAHTIEKFHSVKLIDEIYISSQPENFELLKKIITKNNFKKVKGLVEGGETRQASVYNAINSIEAGKSDIILVHDSVRPFISKKLIVNLISECHSSGGVIPGIKISDTVKRTDEKGFIVKTLPRENLWTVQTPQVFRYDIIKNSLDKAAVKNFWGTDEAAAVEFAGYPVKIIDGEKANIKITHKVDLKHFNR
ncbi:MAG: 2-C-methyl-D-erythritol 4-phosphate cytidylyltransferase [Ignavibacteria bacterium]|nr:2-C-methyl-D-erythritol 4-phosphate cytidylyltransferase [Ignavibacteria bacterium]